MKIHKLSGYLQSFYIVEYESALLLLDGLSRPDIKTLEHYISKNLARKMSDIKLIVCTHPHPDHAGAASYLRDKYKIQIATHIDYNLWYKGINGYLKHKIEIQLAHFSALLKGKKRKNLNYPRLIDADFTLKEGDLIPYFNEWLVIETPGHTNCDISLYHKDTRKIYVADLFLMLSDKVSVPIPVSDFSKYRDSLTKVIDLDVETALLAHNGIKTIDREALIKIRDTFKDIPFNNLLRSLAVAKPFLKRKLKKFFPRF